MKANDERRPEVAEANMPEWKEKIITEDFVGNARRGEDPRTASIPDYHGLPPGAKNIPSNIKKSSSALEFLKLLFDETIMEKLVSETNKSGQAGCKTTWHDVTMLELWKYFCILLVIGVVKLPERRMYWSRDEFLG